MLVDKEIELHTFPSLGGYVMMELSKNSFDQLKVKVQNIQNNFSKSIPHNSKLAGNIEKEFLIDDISFLKDELTLLIKNYDVAFSFTEMFSYCTHHVPLTIMDAWVNFQQKHEFNPFHDHHGVFSFVTWIKVPYDIKEEQKDGPGSKSNSNLAGSFAFYYTTATGRIVQTLIPVDKTYEGKIILFPACLNHMVYPFYTSDEYRISVSGNVKLETSKYAN